MARLPFFRGSAYKHTSVDLMDFFPRLHTWPEKDRLKAEPTSNFRRLRYAGMDCFRFDTDGHGPWYRKLQETECGLKNARQNPRDSLREISAIRK